MIILYLRTFFQSKKILFGEDEALQRLIDFDMCACGSPVGLGRKAGSSLVGFR